MGKFSDYVGSIKQQTELLRTNLTQATGQDCSGKSIAQCAGVVSDYISESEVSEDAYVRPSWYPDIEDIIKNAPDITVSGTTYRPWYILLLANTEATTPFYTNNSTTSTARNYYRGTGCQAVLCSDDCNKDIANASAETLQVGSTIEHTWDVTKDYTDPTGQDYNVRWAIIYSSSNLSNSAINCFFSGYCPVVEVVCLQGMYGINNGSGFDGTINSNRQIDILEYVKLCKDMKFYNNSRPYGILQGRDCLKKLIWEGDGNQIVGASSIYQLSGLNELSIKNVKIKNDSAYCFAYLYSLKYLDLSGCTAEGSTSGAINYNHSLKTLILPESVAMPSTLDGLYNLTSVIIPNTVTSITQSTGVQCYNLKYVKIPSSVTTITSGIGLFPRASYIELYNDFNCSGVVFSFTGREAKGVKSKKWFKDLCVWLKDRTGDTANTIVVGTGNLSIMNNIYLTYNPNDINDITFDGVTSSTEGAMSIVDYISNVKNWTLS